MTDTTLRNINRLFLLSFKNGVHVPKKISFDEYYMLLVEIMHLRISKILMH